MKTLNDYLTEARQIELPFLQKHPIKDNALIVDKDKWSLSYPPGFEMFQILAKGKIVNVEINSRPSDHAQFELYFSDNPSIPKGYMSLSNREEDPLAADRAGQFRYARFPLKTTKKEKMRKPDDLLFGTSEQRTQTHVVIINLSEISKQMEKYLDDPESYKQDFQSKTEFKLTDEDKEIIGDFVL